MAIVLLGVEQITKALVRCAMYEKLYVFRDPQLQNYENMSKSLVALYASILKFLAGARRYLEKPSMCITTFAQS